MRSSNRAFLLFSLLCVALFAAASLHAASAAKNLLSGRAPSSAHGVANAKVLTDGQCAHEGEDWNSITAAIFESERSFVEYDLGQSTAIVAAYVQGDNNDDYLLSVSDDRRNFTPLWDSGKNDGVGLRQRWSNSLNGKGRYVRLTVQGGDGAYSATELQLFAERPAEMPPPLVRVAGQTNATRVRTCLLYLAFAFGVFLFTSRAGSRPIVLACGAALVLLAAGFALDAVNSAWPIGSREVSFVRATAGGIALLAMWRCAVASKRFAVHRGVVTASLIVSAVLACASFYNLGRPQFRNHAENRPEFVHTYDMRVYQPFAKYFPELQYDGVYLASVLAYSEDELGGSLDPIGRTEVRSLRDHKVRLVSEIAGEVRGIRQRFTPERWAALKKDMHYFESVMGPEFLSTLTDHGANATPVWVFFARLLLAHGEATEQSLTLAALADGVLLALMALAIWRSFGLWPMLVSLTVFGANDLYMFATNWSGATLRHDWLALLGFAACALKRRHWSLAGVCLGLSTMIRAFPAAALIGIPIPALWWGFEYFQRERKLPSLKLLLAEHRAAVRVVAVALLTMIVAVLVTGMLYSFSSWSHWWDKVTLLNREGSLNEVSLRALVAGSDGNAARALEERRPIHLLAVFCCFGTVAVLARRRPLHEAMLLGLPLALVLWNPSNYYSHLVFLLALLGSVAVAPKSEPSGDASDANPPKAVPLNIPLHWVAVPLLVLCVLGYWSALDQDIERHFQDETLILFVTFAWLYATLLRQRPGLGAELFLAPATGTGTPASEPAERTSAQPNSDAPSAPYLPGTPAEASEVGE